MLKSTTMLLTLCTALVVIGACGGNGAISPKKSAADTTGAQPAATGHPPAAAPDKAETAASKGTQSSGLLKPGDKAPEVSGRDASGRLVRLSELSGKSAVVYFYPKDDTPGCTVEAQAFRDAAERYATAGITVFGVSRDSTESHTAFQKQHDLPFPLVADVDGQVQRAYGVPSIMGMALTARVSFLVDGAGNIAHVWDRVDPATHATAVLTEAAKLP